VASALLTRDLGALRALERPRWQRRALAWAIPAATGTVIALHIGATPVADCTPATPCAPDPASALGLGLALSIAVVGVIDATSAGWLAVVFTVAGIAYDLVHPAIAGPPWLYAADLALAAGCLLIARFGRVRQPHGPAIAWLAGVRYERPPAPAELPRLGRGWRTTAIALALLALGFAVLTWSVQARMNARQQVAARVPAEVVGPVDEFTVRVRTGERTMDIGVLDAGNYRTGQQIELYLDHDGLHQPVTEPYDASGWLTLTALLAGIALACVRRGRQARAALRHLFGEAQPVNQVYVRGGWGRLAVYPADARPGEPPATELRVLTSPALLPESWSQPESQSPPESGDAEEEEVFALPPTRPATLYGVPAPGRWCTAVVDGVPVVPLRPLPGSVNAPEFTDPLVTVDVETPIPQPVPRPEEIEALSPEDRDSNPYQVRGYTPPALFGYPLMAAVPLSLIPVMKLLPDLPYLVALGLAGVVVAGSCWIGWRLFLRPRAAWNGAGIAIVGTLGGARLRWPDVVAIDVSRTTVTVQTDEAGWVLPAVSLPGPLRGTERNAEQLANALRLARGRGMAAPGGLEPPQLPAVAAPAWPYLLWLGWSPVLAWLLQLFSRY
jgi:hypothetical protein